MKWIAQTEYLVVAGKSLQVKFHCGTRFTEVYVPFRRPRKRGHDPFPCRCAARHRFSLIEKHVEQC
ncbi:hypothetical protein THTE_2326 [Thermogutta terrifontis]|uniref:Uncharacterized protein n=1 Tax=Thermogutta terrifontis TaxID=1331910 RepID=A0A286RG37_9BACT|nr:hypothetical protein THTE_2326 [Thermogutta terrifontis]